MAELQVGTAHELFCRTEGHCLAPLPTLL